jgi:hypothetical protein
MELIDKEFKREYDKYLKAMERLEKQEKRAQKEKQEEYSEEEFDNVWGDNVPDYGEDPTEKNLLRESLGLPPLPEKRKVVHDIDDSDYDNEENRENEEEEEEDSDFMPVKKKAKIKKPLKIPKPKKAPKAKKKTFTESLDLMPEDDTDGEITPEEWEAIRNANKFSIINFKLNFENSLEPKLTIINYFKYLHDILDMYSDKINRKVQ